MEFIKMNKGFTLVELLVVICIIILLVSIITPSIRAAKELAHASTCASNLHNIGLAWNACNSGKINTIRTNYKVCVWAWPIELFPFLGNNPDALLCPKDDKPTRAGLDAVRFRVYSGGNFLYDMDVFSDSTYDYDTPKENDLTWKVNEEEYQRLVNEGLLSERRDVRSDLTRYTPGSNPDSYYLLFEDIRPSGGDYDYEDMVVHVTENKNGMKITTTKGVAGYTFDLFGQDNNILASDVGKTPAEWDLSTIPTSYGVNTAIASLSTSKEIIVALDYRKAIANFVGDDADGNWDEHSAMRHRHKCNVLFKDGSVRRKTSTQVDPTDLNTLNDIWSN